MAKKVFTLTPEQCATMRTRLLGHGQVTAGAKKADVSRWTLYNAMAGKPLSEKVYYSILIFCL